MLAPLVVQGKRVGTLIAFYRAVGRPSQAELRVVQEAASLVSAQVELSVVAEQERRLAQAELRALRAQISPHFIYNALAAVAGEIHDRPEEARELLIDFAQFTRYLFRDGRSYVTLGEEIDHVERYLRLEQARFRGPQRDDRRSRRGARRRGPRDVDPAAGRERGPARGRAAGRIRAGRDRRPGSRAATSSCGCATTAPGSSPSACPSVLAGAGGGIGVSNVDARLRATFGERYALRIESGVGRRDDGGDDGPEPPGRAASGLELAPAHGRDEHSG